MGTLIWFSSCPLDWVWGPQTRMTSVNRQLGKRGPRHYALNAKLSGLTFGHRVLVSFMPASNDQGPNGTNKRGDFPPSRAARRG